MARCTSSPDFATLSSSASTHTLCAPPSPPPQRRTALARELDAIIREDGRKTQELARVKCIAEQESKRLQESKERVEGMFSCILHTNANSLLDLKQALVAELTTADDQLGRKMQEFKQKQQAIEKVTARAERERSRSVFLKDEIISMFACFIH